MRRDADFAQKKRMTTRSNRTFATNDRGLYPATSKRHHKVVAETSPTTPPYQFFHSSTSATTIVKNPNRQNQSISNWLTNWLINHYISKNTPNFCSMRNPIHRRTHNKHTNTYTCIYTHLHKGMYGFIDSEREPDPPPRA